MFRGALSFSPTFVLMQFGSMYTKKGHFLLPSFFSFNFFFSSFSYFSYSYYFYPSFLFKSVLFPSSFILPLVLLTSLLSFLLYNPSPVLCSHLFDLSSLLLPPLFPCLSSSSPPYVLATHSIFSSYFLSCPLPCCGRTCFLLQLLFCLLLWDSPKV